MRPSMVIVYIIALAIVAAGEMRIRGKVRKRNNAHRRHRAILPPCNFNESLIEDEWALMEAIGKSKFIFTGKVLTVKKFRSIRDVGGRRSNLYKVYMRRVVKGNESDLRQLVNQEGPSADSLSGSTLMAERPRAQESCAPGPRPRLSAIFLSDGVNFDGERGPTPRLRLLTDPVPLTLYHLDRINAAVKDFHMCQSCAACIQRLSVTGLMSTGHHVWEGRVYQYCTFRCENAQPPSPWDLND